MSQIEADSMLLLLRGLVVPCCAVPCLLSRFPLPSSSSVFCSVFCPAVSILRVTSHHNFPRSIFAFLQIFTVLLSMLAQLHNGKWALTRSDMNLKFEIELEIEKRRVKRRAHRCQELPIRVIEMVH
jgi:hypothetical protein